MSTYSLMWPPETTKDRTRQATYYDQRLGAVSRSELKIARARSEVWAANQPYYNTIEETAKFYSPLEGDLLAALWWYDLRPELQVPFGAYRVDMLFPDEHVAVEVDGRGNHDRTRDRVRDACLRDTHDLIVKRFHAKDVYSNPLACAAAVRGTVQWIHERLHLVTGAT